MIMSHNGMPTGWYRRNKVNANTFLWTIFFWHSTNFRVITNRTPPYVGKLEQTLPITSTVRLSVWGNHCLASNTCKYKVVRKPIPHNFHSDHRTKKTRCDHVLALALCNIQFSFLNMNFENHIIHQSAHKCDRSQRNPFLRTDLSENPSICAWSWNEVFSRAQHDTASGDFSTATAQKFLCSWNKIKTLWGKLKMLQSIAVCSCTA